MARKNYMSKKQQNNLVYLLVAFVAAALIIPSFTLGAEASSTWTSIHGFFSDVQNHLSSFWMFYTLGLAAWLGLRK